MHHARRQLRDAIAARLIAECPSVEGRVFVSRPFGPAPGESPCVILFTPSEAVELQERGRARPQRRVITANLLVYARETEGADDECDAVSVEVEKALADWRAVHPALEDLSYAGAQLVVVQGEVQHGVVQLAFQGTLYTRPGAPEAPFIQV